jgi:ornithine cyclodeaminase
MLILNRSELRSVASMTDAIALMKQAFQELSAGKAVSPLRTPIDVGDELGVSLFMPAFVPGSAALGMKLVSVFPQNPAKGLPTIHAVVCLVSADTGEPLALIEGGYLTALRTGAVSGAATDLLARPESSTLVVIGSGVQGMTQAAAVCAVRPIDRLIVVGRDQKRLDQFKASVSQELPAYQGSVETSTKAGEVVPLADIICTATTSKTPVFDDSDLQPGVHINAVGAFTPAMQEIPSATIARSRVIVDLFSHAYAEAGDLIYPVNEGLVTPDHYHDELGMLVAGTVKGRTDPEQITFFKSVGNAVQDVVVAKLAFERATALSIGQDVDLYA